MRVLLWTGDFFKVETRAEAIALAKAKLEPWVEKGDSLVTYEGATSRQLLVYVVDSTGEHTDACARIDL